MIAVLLLKCFHSDLELRPSTDPAAERHQVYECSGACEPPARRYGVSYLCIVCSLPAPLKYQPQYNSGNSSDRPSYYNSFGHGVFHLRPPPNAFMNALSPTVVVVTTNRAPQFVHLIMLRAARNLCTRCSVPHLGQFVSTKLESLELSWCAVSILWIPNLRINRR